MRLNSLEDVYDEQIADLLSAEKQLVEALPKVAAAASTDKLREAFESHLDETREHVRRLEAVIDMTGRAVPDETCDAMQGLLTEGEEVVDADGDAKAKDAALIAAAQRVEHYEMAVYGTARTLADQLGYDDARDLLSKTFQEEAEADKKLSSIATGGMVRSGVNEEAAER